MLTDAEVDALAREVLNTTVTRLREWDLPVFDDVTEVEGEAVITYAATHEHGYGSFLCKFIPLDPTKKIIKTCEELFDNFGIEVFDKNTGKSAKKLISEGHDPDSRAYSIKMMAECAMFQMLGSARERFGDAIEELFADGEMLAKTMLQAVTAEALADGDFGEVTADMRAEIDQAVSRVGDKKRAYLREQIRNLPHVLAERGRGRKKKSQSEREREREAYTVKIADAYREVRTEAGKKPTKVSIADRLGEGGINPKGGDSRANAFNLKLTRLGINYDEIAKSVEAELHKNSG